MMPLWNDAQRFRTLAWSRIRKRPIPWLVNLFVTERCNLSCYYCYVNIARQKNEDPRVPPDRPLVEMKRIIRELREAGTRQITLLGGEPLLRPDIDEIVSYIREQGIVVDAFTNGTLIDRRLETVKKLDALIVSLEGPPEVHEGERGEKKYGKVIENILLAKKAGVPLRINMTITRNNLRELDYVVGFAKKHGLTVTAGEATKNYYDNELVNQSMPSPDELSSFYDRMQRLIEEGAPILKSPRALSQLKEAARAIGHDEILMSDDPRMRSLGLFPCQFGRYACQLSVDGKFYPCSKLYGHGGESIDEHGVRGAFERMASQTKCVSCRMSLVCGLTGFLNLDPSTLYETIRYRLTQRQGPSAVDEQVL